MTTRPYIAEEYQQTKTRIEHVGGGSASFRLSQTTYQRIPNSLIVAFITLHHSLHQESCSSSEARQAVSPSVTRPRHSENKSLAKRERLVLPVGCICLPGRRCTTTTPLPANQSSKPVAVSFHCSESIEETPAKQIRSIHTFQ